MKKAILVVVLGLMLQGCFLDDLVGEGGDDDGRPSYVNPNGREVRPNDPVYQGPFEGTGEKPARITKDVSRVDFAAQKPYPHVSVFVYTVPKSTKSTPAESQVDSKG